MVPSSHTSLRLTIHYIIVLGEGSSKVFFFLFPLKNFQREQEGWLPLYLSTLVSTDLKDKYLLLTSYNCKHTQITGCYL